MINPRIMTHLETVNKLQYFKCDETNLLEKRDCRGNFLQCITVHCSARDTRTKINMLIAVVPLCLVLFSRFCWTHSTGVLRVPSSWTSTSSKGWRLVVQERLTLRKKYLEEEVP